MSSLGEREKKGTKELVAEKKEREIEENERKNKWQWQKQKKYLHAPFPVCANSAGPYLTPEWLLGCPNFLTEWQTV